MTGIGFRWPALTTYFLLSCVLVNSGANASEISGEMTCKVKSQSILAIEDGKPETYSHYTGYFKTGDTVTFGYVEESGDWTLVFNDEKNTILAQFLLRRNMLAADQIAKDEDEQAVAYQRLIEFYWFSEDTIRYYDGEFRIFLDRYYKDDWHGIFSRLKSNRTSVETWIATLDCRQTLNKIGRAVEDALRYIK